MQNFRLIQTNRILEPAYTLENRMLTLATAPSVPLTGLEPATSRFRKPMLCPLSYRGGHLPVRQELRQLLICFYSVDRRWFPQSYTGCFSYDPIEGILSKAYGSRQVHGVSKHLLCAYWGVMIFHLHT